MLRRWGRRLAIVLGLAGLGLWLSLSSGDPALYPGGEDGVVIHVVDHGYHSGLILNQSAVRRAALTLMSRYPDKGARLRWLTSRIPEAEWIEVGWGDSAFYQATPGVEDIQMGLALTALFVPTDAVLQIVPGWGGPADGFPRSDIVALPLSEAGFLRLLDALAETVPEKPSAAALGPSLYGRGGFYPAELDYHLFRTCNHWVASLLRAAGVPASAVPGTFSATLMAELRWRAL